MKVLLTMALFISSFAVSASTIQLKIGKGGHICAANGVKRIPVMARSTSKRYAEILALRACARVEGDRFSYFCKVTECTSDKSSSRLSIKYRKHVKGNKTSIKLRTKGAAVSCESSHFGKYYYSEAPTRLEAKVLAAQACIEKNPQDAIFCEVDNRDCVKMHTARSLRDEAAESLINEGLRGLFRRR